MLTVLVFVVVLGVFQTVNKGLALSEERLGADALLVPKYAATKGDDLLFAAIPENIYIPIEMVEEVKRFDGIAAMTPQFYCQTLALSCCGPGEEARVIGYEPTNDLDEHWSEEIIRVLKEQTEKGTAVVMVTHNSRWAQKATRRCRLEVCTGGYR